MTPIGPYTSPWTTLPHYIVSTVHNNQSVVSIVPNGVQAKDGTICPSLKEAKQYMKYNGFEKKS